MTAILLVLIKKPLKADEIDDLAVAHDEEEVEVDLSGFSLT